MSTTRKRFTVNKRITRKNKIRIHIPSPLSEPLQLERITVSEEQLKEWEKLYGPMLTRAERASRYVMRTSTPFTGSRKIHNLAMEEEGAYVPSYMRK